MGGACPDPPTCGRPEPLTLVMARVRAEIAASQGRDGHRGTSAFVGAYQAIERPTRCRGIGRWPTSRPPRHGLASAIRSLFNMIVPAVGPQCTSGPPGEPIRPTMRRVPVRPAARGVLAGGHPSRRVLPCSMTPDPDRVSTAARPARAANSSATPSAASAAWRWPRCFSDEQARAARRRPAGPQAAPPAGQGDGGDLPVHGRRAQPPRDVRPQAAVEPARRAAPAEGVRRRQVPVRSSATPSCSGPAGPSRSTARAASRSPTSSPTPPAASTTSPSSARATATWSSTRPPSTSCSPAGSCPGFPSMGSWVLYGLGSESRLAAGLCRDARPQGAPRSRPADVLPRLPAGRLPADDVPARRPAGAQPRPARGRRPTAGGGARWT